jgi:hypothetical protein
VEVEVYFEFNLVVSIMRLAWETARGKSAASPIDVSGEKD